MLLFATTKSEVSLVAEAHCRSVVAFARAVVAVLRQAQIQTRRLHRGGVRSASFPARTTSSSARPPGRRQLGSRVPCSSCRFSTSSAREPRCLQGLQINTNPPTCTPATIQCRSRSSPTRCPAGCRRQGSAYWLPTIVPFLVLVATLAGASVLYMFCTYFHENVTHKSSVKMFRIIYFY